MAKSTSHSVFTILLFLGCKPILGAPISQPSDGGDFVPLVVGNLRGDRAGLHNKEQTSLFPDQIITDADNEEIDRRNLVTSGVKADENAYPYFVHIYTESYDRQKNAKFYFTCGGTLIYNDIILTAAHCAWEASDKPIKARIGGLRDDANDAEWINIIDKNAHEDYNGLTMKNDIMLLKLESQPKVFQPVSLNFQKKTLFNKYGPDEDDFAFVLGHGDTVANDPKSKGTELQFGWVKVTDEDNCKGALEQYQREYGEDSALSLFKYDDDEMMCAGGKDSGDLLARICTGDSGGPLMWTDNYDNEKRKQIGITSWSFQRTDDPTRCTEEDDVYTRVSHYEEWIKNGICDMTHDKYRGKQYTGEFDGGLGCEECKFWQSCDYEYSSSSD